jgi:hypothetical protein
MIGIVSGERTIFAAVLCPSPLPKLLLVSIRGPARLPSAGSWVPRKSVGLNDARLYSQRTQTFGRIAA